MFNGKLFREGGFHAWNLASCFYLRGHIVGSLKIKTFTGKSTRRVLLWVRGHGPRKINDDKPHFASRGCIHSPPLPLDLSARVIPAFIRSRRRGRNLYHVFPSRLSCMKRNIGLLPPGVIFNRLSIVIEWRLAALWIKCARSMGHEINTAPGI